MRTRCRGQHERVYSLRFSSTIISPSRVYHLRVTQPNPRDQLSLVFLYCGHVISYDCYYTVLYLVVYKLLSLLDRKLCKGRDDVFLSMYLSTVYHLIHFLPLEHWVVQRRYSRLVCFMNDKAFSLSTRTAVP